MPDTPKFTPVSGAAALFPKTDKGQSKKTRVLPKQAGLPKGKSFKPQNAQSAKPGMVPGKGGHR